MVIDFYCCHSPNNSTSHFPDYVIPTFFCVLNTFLYLICDWQSMKSLLEADVIDWLSITSCFHIQTYKCDWPDHIDYSIHSHLSRSVYECHTDTPTKMATAVLITLLLGKHCWLHILTPSKIDNHLTSIRLELRNGNSNYRYHSGK
jgi:hypothetical protein